MSKKKASSQSISKASIIAVGGAKGGVGKSLLAANMGVYLASRGYRTVVIDLDLGAANLHLYLGVWALKHRINDFLDKKVDDLGELAVAADSGLCLIGGGSNRLGAANLPFARKLKLMRAIRKLDADYVILDLGGDTSYNILDFFLMADHGLVMTTCDPASYLDAYTFIKMALYRRLMRLFGPESAYCKFRDNQVLAIIREFCDARQTEEPRKISDLLEQVRFQSPQSFPMIQTVVQQYQPYLVVNKADDANTVKDLVQRMQKVTLRILSTNVFLAGIIPTHKDIARSALDLKPEVGRHPYGVFARTIREILKKAVQKNHLLKDKTTPASGKTRHFDIKAQLESLITQ